MTVDTTALWQAIAELRKPYSHLLLGRTEKEYYKEGEEDLKRLLQPHILQLQKKFSRINTLEIGPGLHRFQIPLLRILRPGDTSVVVDIVERFLKAAPLAFVPNATSATSQLVRLNFSFRSAFSSTFRLKFGIFTPRRSHGS